MGEEGIRSYTRGKVCTRLTVEPRYEWAVEGLMRSLLMLLEQRAGGRGVLSTYVYWVIHPLFPGLCGFGYKSPHLHDIQNLPKIL